MTLSVTLAPSILARWDTQHSTRTVYTAGEFSEEYAGAGDWDEPMVTSFNRYPPHKSQCRRRFVCPEGTLTQIWEYTRDAGADFETEHWWKSWDDYAAVRFMLEAREYAFDAADFQNWVERVGDDGLVMVHLTQSALKTFHWLAGPENASLFMLDHPEEMQALARIHEKKALALLESIVDNPLRRDFHFAGQPGLGFLPALLLPGLLPELLFAGRRYYPSPGEILCRPRLRPQPGPFADGGGVARRLPGGNHSPAAGGRGVERGAGTWRVQKALP